MRGQKNIKQKKNKRDNEIFSVLKRVYYRKQYMGKEGGFRKYKRVSR